MAQAINKEEKELADANDGYKLVWSDEFDQKNIDPKNWTFETGNGDNGWGNCELQYYLAENARIENNNLVITAKKEKHESFEYTSARLKTQNLKEFKYGKFVARIKIPDGSNIGVWPAFWMLGNNIDKVSWPQCGEIDIMEYIGKEPNTLHAAIHGPNHCGANGLSTAFDLKSDKRFDKSSLEGEYHIYSMEWSKDGVIRWFIDDVLYATQTSKHEKVKDWVFDHDFFILINLAIGGLWGGPPNEQTKFPKELWVDYVRVYQKK